MPAETWTVEPSATRDAVLVLDHFRPERHAVTQLYNKHFLGVVYGAGAPAELSRCSRRCSSGWE